MGGGGGLRVGGGISLVQGQYLEVGKVGPFLFWRDLSEKLCPNPRN